jgi:hypothetical protein
MSSCYAGRHGCSGRLRSNWSNYSWSLVMPQGKGTYGTKKGRPPKKGTKK